MRPRAILLAFAWLAACFILAGCAEDRSARMTERAHELAREGRYDEAIALLEEVQRRDGGTRAARETRDDLVLYRGLRDADLRADRRRAKDDLTALGRALYRHHDRARRFPERLGDLEAAASLPQMDPWGMDYVYRPSKDLRHYRLECYGRDGVPGGSGDDRDLRVENGTFVQDLPWADR